MSEAEIKKPRSQKRQRGLILAVRVSEAEMEAVRFGAEVNQVSVGEFVRLKVFASLPK